MQRAMRVLSCSAPAAEPMGAAHSFLARERKASSSALVWAGRQWKCVALKSDANTASSPLAKSTSAYHHTMRKRE